MLVNFTEVNKKDTLLVGGKGANLGELVQAGVNVPLGFILTVEAYQNFLHYNKLEQDISELFFIKYAIATELQIIRAKNNNLKISFLFFFAF